MKPLDALPSPAEKRIAVRATNDAVRQLRGGSPWLYDGSITTTNTEAGDDSAAGDLAVVFDANRDFVAIGLWDPDSPIRVKVIHAGSPTPIDALWWRRHLGNAIERRASLAADESTNAFRLVHGENDAFPGVVIDQYDRSLVIKIYSAVWFPHLRTVAEALVELVDPVRIVVRLSRNVAAGNTYGLTDGDTIVGESPTRPIRFSERGLTMEADVVHGHKTGHFLDQRDNRALVRAASNGKRVLDVFASTGGFALSAAAGGATGVHLVDVSEQALRAAERNFAQNRHIRAVHECEVRTTTGDAFEVLRELAKRDELYDVVILDPPSFASNAASVERAVSAYKRLTMLGLDVLRPGGLLVQASCSSRVSADEFFAAVHEGASRQHVTLHEIRRTGHALDHPVTFEQGGYLKAIFATT